MRKLSRRSKILIVLAAVIISPLAMIERIDYPISLNGVLAIFAIAGMITFIAALNIAADYEINPDRRFRCIVMDVIGSIMVYLVSLQAAWFIMFGSIGIIFGMKITDISCCAFGCILLIIIQRRKKE